MTHDELIRRLVTSTTWRHKATLPELQAYCQILGAPGVGTRRQLRELILHKLRKATGQPVK